MSLGGGPTPGSVRDDRARAAPAQRRRPPGDRRSPRPAPWSCWPGWPRSSWRAPGSAEVRHTFFNPRRHVAVLHRQPEEGLLLGGRGPVAEHPDVHRGRDPHPDRRPGDRPDPAVDQRGGVPVPGAEHDLRGLLPRRAAAPDHPGHRLRRARAPAAVRLVASPPRSTGWWRSCCRTRRTSVRGLPCGPELGAPEPGRRRALAWPVPGHHAALRGPAAGRAQHHPAAAQRLHQPAEGHRAGRRARRDRGERGGPDLLEHRVQLLQLHRGRDPVPDPDHPAGPVHRPADRPRPPAAPGRGRRRDRRRSRPRPPRARRSGSRACASRSATTRC